MFRWFWRARVISAPIATPPANVSGDIRSRRDRMRAFHAAMQQASAYTRAEARRVAYHEAGHACANVHYFAGVSEVRLNLTDVGASGSCTARDTSRENVLTAMAGFASEVAFGFGFDRERILQSSDYIVAQIAHTMNPSDYEPLEAVKSGGSLLREWFPESVHAIASELLHVGYISGDAAEHMIEAGRLKRIGVVTGGPHSSHAAVASKELIAAGPTPFPSTRTGIAETRA